MFNVYEFVLPLLLVLLIVLPLVTYFKKIDSKKKIKSRLLIQVSLFFALITFGLIAQVVGMHVYAAATVSAISGTTAQGLGFLGAAMATGLSSLGAGIAVASAGAAAIGAFSENPKNFGRSLVFVALGEGIAIYGLLISILIINYL